MHLLSVDTSMFKCAQYCFFYSPEIEGGAPFVILDPVSRVEDWTEAAWEQNTEVVGRRLQLEFTSQSTVEHVRLWARSLATFNTNPTQHFVDDFLVHHNGEQQVVVIAVVVSPQSPQAIFIGVGVCNADVAVAGKDWLVHALLLNPPGKVLHVVAQVLHINLNVILSSCLIYMCIVASIVTRVVPGVVAFLVESLTRFSLPNLTWASFKSKVLLADCLSTVTVSDHGLDAALEIHVESRADS